MSSRSPEQIIEQAVWMGRMALLAAIVMLGILAVVVISRDDPTPAPITVKVCTPRSPSGEGFGFVAPAC